jgi:hypothetical protein
MAVNPYGSDVLQSLNRILQYKQAQDKSDVQQALQIMQYSQSKRMTDMQTMAKNLEIMKGTNDSLKLKAANKFVTQSGLAGLYASNSESTNAMSDAVDDLYDTKKWFPSLGEDSIDKETAKRLVSATWALYTAKDADPIMELLSPIGEMANKGIMPRKGTKDYKLVEALKKMDYISADMRDNEEVMDVLNSMTSAQKVEADLLEETEGFMKGDYQLQKDFTFTQKAIENLEKEVKTKQPPTSKETEVEWSNDPASQLRMVESRLQTKQQHLNDSFKDLDALDEYIQQASDLSSMGQSIPTALAERVEHQDAIKSALNQRVESLGRDIADLKQLNIDLRDEYGLTRKKFDIGQGLDLLSPR